MYRITSRAADVVHDGVDRLGVDDRVALRHLGAAALATHGVLHVMGITLIWRWNGPGNPRLSSLTPSPGSAPGVAVGYAWLVAGVLFVTAAILLARGHHSWRMLATVGVAVSVAALLPFTDAALYGLFADSAVLLGVLLTRATGTRPGRDEVSR